MADQKNKNFLFHALSLVFKKPASIYLAAGFAFGLLVVYYLLLLQTTTLGDFLISNFAIYNWLSIILTLFICFFFGIAISFLILCQRQEKVSNPTYLGNILIGVFLGALSIGSPTQGAFLAQIFKIPGGVAAFPFQGLEIKVISLVLLSFVILFLAKSISNIGKAAGESVSGKSFLENNKIKTSLFNKINKFGFVFLATVGFSFLILVPYLPAIADKLDYGFIFQRPLHFSSIGDTSKINPPEGYTINAVYGVIGPKLLEVGAIDFEKMKSLYEKRGNPLTNEQIKILIQGSDEKIKITPENSYFLLNFLWAFGLANKNPILEEGPMMKYGGDQIGNFSSTGGWTLGSKEATKLYSSFKMAELNPQQQDMLEDFAYNSYRPCCSNSTGFPDCNHGMAALGLGEIMISQGASVEEVFEAFKYVNSFWFPQTYLDIAKYFEEKEGKDWQEVDARLVSGKDYSTPQGWGRVRTWLSANDLREEVSSSGGSCGV